MSNSLAPAGRSIVKIAKICVLFLLFCDVTASKQVAIDNSCPSCRFTNPVQANVRGGCVVHHDGIEEIVPYGHTISIRGAWLMWDKQSEAEFTPNMAMKYKCDKNGLIQYSGDQDPFCKEKCIYPAVDTIRRKTNYPLRADPCEVGAPTKLLEKSLEKIRQYSVSYHNAVGNQHLSLETAQVQKWRNDIKTSFPGLFEKDHNWLGHVTSGELVKAVGDACIVINTEQDRIDYRNPETGKKYALGYFQCDHLTVLRRKSAGFPSKGPHDLDYCRATVSGQVRGEFITKEYKVWTILKTYPACTIWDHFYPNSKCGTQDKRYEGVKKLTEEIKGLTKPETKLLIDFTSTIHAFNKSNCWTKYYENVGLQIDQRHCPIEKKFYRIGDLVFRGREFINATHQLTGSNKHDDKHDEL